MAELSLDTLEIRGNRAGDWLEIDGKASLVSSILQDITSGQAGTYAPSAGNPTVALGTSITSNTADATGDSRGASSWFSWACLQSDSQITFTRNAGVAGNTAAQMLARFAADVVAYSPRNVIIEAGANDAYSSSTPVASFADSIKAIVAAALAANIRPILTTVMQRSDIASTLVEQYNVFLRAYAKFKGLTLIDFHQAMLNKATGLTAAANTADGLHPSAAGAQIMGQAAADALTTLPLWVPPLAKHQAAHSQNLVANALFLNSSGGLATGWAVDQGSGTPTIVAGDGVNVLGNWQRLSLNPGAAQTVVHCPINTVAVAAGDRLAFSGWYQSSCTAGDTASITMYWWPSGLAVIPVFNFPGATGAHRFYAEAVAPASNTGFAVYLILPAGAGGNNWAQIAQPTVLNLTALGIPALLA